MRIYEYIAHKPHRCKDQILGVKILGRSRAQVSRELAEYLAYGIAIAPADAIGSPPQLSEAWLKTWIQRSTSRRAEQVRQITQGRFETIVEAFIDVTNELVN